MSASPQPGAPHVLMTADAVGGVWTYALDLGQELVRMGLRVTLAVIGPQPESQALAQGQAAGLEVRCLGGELDWTAEDEAEVAASAARLFALVAEARPHLLHLNSPALAAFGSFPLPVVAACHSCVATWWSAVKGETPLPPNLAWRAGLTARGYAAVDALLAPSRAFAEATRAAFGSPKPHVVLNGRSGALAVERERKAFATTVLTAGRLWDEGKDVATLDRAAGRLDLAVAAAGPLDGPQGQAATLRNVQALGRLSEAALGARLAAYPIFVSASLYEPFGLAVLEAAQAGCPLVLSDIATFRELWDGAAAFFPPGDAAALAAHLDALASDAGRRAALGDAARARSARYTAAAMADATLRLYASLCPAFARSEAAA